MKRGKENEINPVFNCRQRQWQGVQSRRKLTKSTGKIERTERSKPAEELSNWLQMVQFLNCTATKKIYKEEVK